MYTVCVGYGKTSRLTYSYQLNTNCYRYHFDKTVHSLTDALSDGQPIMAMFAGWRYILVGVSKKVSG